MKHAGWILLLVSLIMFYIGLNVEGIVGDETGTILLMCFMIPFLVYFGNKLGEITSMLEDKDREEKSEEE